jgi:hypothetical protein
MSVKCEHCERTFSDDNARWQHTKAKHGTKAAKAVKPQNDAEPSMADLFIEASWNDDPSLDWVRDMMP